MYWGLETGSYTGPDADTHMPSGVERVTRRLELKHVKLGNPCRVQRSLGTLLGWTVKAQAETAEILAGVGGSKKRMLAAERQEEGK